MSDQTLLLKITANTFKGCNSLEIKPKQGGGFYITPIVGADNLTKEPNKAKPWPQKGDDYFYISDVEEIESHVFDGDSIDLYLINTGNVFKTKADAELCLEIQNRAIELRGDWVADWSDVSQEKWCLYWDHLSNSPLSELWLGCQRQGIFYMPRSAAKTLIKEYGDKLKVFICGGLPV